MEKNTNDKQKLWNNKKISYVGVLIAVSVVFVLIGSMILAITSFPTFKVAFGGLPIKLTGYIFGPIIGIVTGAIADFLSFIYLPTYYHIAYTIIMILAGLIPGMVMLFFKKINISKKYYLIIAVSFLSILVSALFTLIQFLPQSILDDIKLPFHIKIHNRLVIQLILTSGMILLIIATFILYIFMNYENFKNIVPIIIAISLLEICNDLITPWGDNQTLKVPYATAAITHIIISPIKMLFNITVLFLGWKVIYPLIQSKKNNSYD